MFEISYPWLFLLLPAPLLVHWLVPPYQQRQDAVRVPFFQSLVELTGIKPAHGSVVAQRMAIQKILILFSWFLLVIALSRPVWIADAIEQTRSARDLMVAVDLSGSMETADFYSPDGEKSTRMEAVRQILGEFADTREHDRLGLIVFGDSAYLQAPFTEDRQVWLELVNELQVAMAGQKTMLGDAIGLSIKIFEKSETGNRVLMLLTDGNDTGNRVPPVEAAKVAKNRGVKIYAIAIGDSQTAGEEKLDIDTLEAIAGITDGEFYHALNREELEAGYQAIDRLEPEEYETLSYRPKISLHYWPLGIVAGCYLLFLALMVLISRQRQKRVDNELA